MYFCLLYICFHCELKKDANWKIKFKARNLKKINFSVNQKYLINFNFNTARLFCSWFVLNVLEFSGGQREFVPEMLRKPENWHNVTEFARATLFLKKGGFSIIKSLLPMQSGGIRLLPKLCVFCHKKYLGV